MGERGGEVTSNWTGELGRELVGEEIGDMTGEETPLVGVGM